MRRIFGEWKPDQPAHLYEGLDTADGCLPIENGYAPLPSFSAAIGGELEAPCLGAVAYRPNEETFIFAADATDIYRYNGEEFSSLINGLNNSAAAGVRFCVYNGLMLATNGEDPIQRFDPENPTLFEDLDASTPKARFMAVVRGFVVAGYTAGNGLRLAWSDNGDPTEWSPGTGEAGFYLMPGGGNITGVVGGEYGLIFQENRIIRMTYTADDAVWQFDEIATDVGCIAPWSLASYGRLSFFLSNKGLMACDGVSVQAIGSEKVDRTFLSLMDRSYLDMMSAVVDPRSSLYIVAVPSADPASQVFIYHYALQRWTSAPLSTRRMFSAVGLDVTLEQLEDSYGALDDVPETLDSAMFRGGYPLMMLFDGEDRLGALTGPNVAATFVDGRSDLFTDKKSRVRSIRPLSDAENLTVSVAVAQSPADMPTETSFTKRSPAGVYRMRQSGSLTQVKLSIPSGSAWSFAQGYDIDALPGGRA